MASKIPFYSAVRPLLRSAVLDVLGLFASPKPGIHILNGHRTAGEHEPETFRKLLQGLAEEVEFIRIEDAVQRILRHDRPEKPLVAFTFDDGFMDCYDCFAPVLEEFGTNGLFFINPNYVDGDGAYIRRFNEKAVLTPGKQPMRWEHLQALAARGHLIGAHTMDHFMIVSDDETVLKYQVSQCKEVIEAHIDGPCEYFAFPYGRLSQAGEKAIGMACNTYKYIFSQSDYRHYFSFEGRVVNRRHFEPFWPLRHVRYFLSARKT